MRYFIYVLYSPSLLRYYVGSTNNLERRLLDHNSGQSSFTSKGIPWEMLYIEEAATRAEATLIEKRVKKRGIARYLLDRGIRPSRGA